MDTTSSFSQQSPDSNPGSSANGGKVTPQTPAFPRDLVASRETWLRVHGIMWSARTSRKKHTAWQLKYCPFNSAHPKPLVMLSWEDGSTTYHCAAPECVANRWAEFVAKACRDQTFSCDVPYVN